MDSHPPFITHGRSSGCSQCSFSSSLTGPLLMDEDTCVMRTLNMQNSQGLVVKLVLEFWGFFCFVFLSLTALLNSLSGGNKPSPATEGNFRLSHGQIIIINPKWTVSIQKLKYPVQHINQNSYLYSRIRLPFHSVHPNS